MRLALLGVLKKFLGGIDSLGGEIFLGENERNFFHHYFRSFLLATRHSVFSLVILVLLNGMCAVRHGTTVAALETFRW